MKLVSWYPYAFYNWDAGPDLLLLYQQDEDAFRMYIVSMTHRYLLVRRN